MKFLKYILLISVLSFQGCADTTSHSTGVYMLMDTSGTYTKQLDQAKTIINYLLGTLESGDSLAVARIDSGSFSEKDIVGKITFVQKPSEANLQKLAFRQKVDDFVSSVKGSSYTDITGGILQAVEYLNETGSGKKYILIFSDLEEDLKKGHIRDFPIQVENIEVVALNVTKLRSDQIDPRKYYKRRDAWKKKITEGGGTFRVINDLERLDTILGK